MPGRLRNSAGKTPASVPVGGPIYLRIYHLSPPKARQGREECEEPSSSFYQPSTSNHFGASVGGHCEAVLPGVTLQEHILKM